jgi:hypothetical protein
MDKRLLGKSSSNASRMPDDEESDHQSHWVVEDGFGFGIQKDAGLI